MLSKPWPKNPIIYEINTWVWLHDLSQRYEKTVTLATIPPHELNAIAELGVHAVWFMGVWERSPQSAGIGREHPGLQAEGRRVLLDFSPQDLVGSPYSVHRYVVDEHLGGPGGLAAARESLAERGIRLVLDFVPNHVAVDHPWVLENPNYLMQGEAEDLVNAPDEFFQAGGKVFAYGRDPYFAPWTDVAQINCFNLGLRHATIETLEDIAVKCDGVRCDMAMLVLNHVFAQTWGQRAGDLPEEEFWPDVIRSTRAKYPGFLFVAEAYWDLERELHEQGFDYCYDKRLYDRLAHKTAESVLLHLTAEVSHQEKLVRFIENHDEPRAAAIFGGRRSRAAALAVSTLPGAKLFHQGQFEGRKVRLPVQLGRSPAEPTDGKLREFYLTLLKEITGPVFRDGNWQMCEGSGWPNNDSHFNLAAWSWRKGNDLRLVVVNLSDASAQGQIHLPWNDLPGRSWRLVDAFSGEIYKRDGDEMIYPGLFVDLEPWGFYLLKFEKV